MPSDNNAAALPAPAVPESALTRAAIIAGIEAQEAARAEGTSVTEIVRSLLAEEISERKAVEMLTAKTATAHDIRADVSDGVVLAICHALSEAHIGEAFDAEGADGPVWSQERRGELIFQARDLIAPLLAASPAVPVATEPVADATAMRRFTVYRRGDLSATHNDQQAAPPDAPQYEGVVFSDGRVALRWLTPLRSTSCWDSLDDALGVHGHPEPRYGTEFVWHDALPAPRPREEGTE